MIETKVGSFEPEDRLLIDGELTEAASGARFGNVNPATEEALGQVCDGGHEDMQRAIAAARRAFDETDWSTNRAFRARCLEQLQEALEADREQMRAELVAETGTPVLITYGPQLDTPLQEAFRWPAKNIEQFEWERELPDSDTFGVRSRRAVIKEPQGVVGAIVPWNFPFEVTANKLGPILATGNTVVLKPAPDTPWNATRLGRLIAEKTGIPAGVVNVVAGSDHLIGEDLTLDPRVNLISFTGSTVTGKRIMEKGAATLKRVFLELGGKSAMIVCDDADFGAVLPMVSMSCTHGGQGCAIQTRILLPRSRYAEGVEIITAGMQNVPYGAPTDPSNIQGPQISARQRDRVMSYSRKGIDEGATLAVGGHRPARFEKGFFVEPTLFTDVDNSMTIAQEEIFGPVLSIIAYNDEEEAVRIANDTPYGLAGAVWSADEARAQKVARRIRAGQIDINGGAFNMNAPFGGFKQSGHGREAGVYGMEEFLEYKSLQLKG